MPQYFGCFQNIEAITKSPDPKRALYELTNKLSTKFCLEKGVLSTDSAGVKMLNNFGNRVEKLSKKLYPINVAMPFLETFI